MAHMANLSLLVRLEMPMDNRRVRGSSHSICLVRQASQVRTKLIIALRLAPHTMRIAVIRCEVGRGPHTSPILPLCLHQILPQLHSFLIGALNKTIHTLTQHL